MDVGRREIPRGNGRGSPRLNYDVETMPRTFIREHPEERKGRTHGEGAREDGFDSAEDALTALEAART